MAGKHKNRALGPKGDSDWKLEVTGSREMVLEIEAAFKETGFGEALAAILRTANGVPAGATHLKKPCGCKDRQ